MANTDVTMRIDENLKAPFQPRIINENYSKKAYQLAIKNTRYNSEGKAVIKKDDEWRDETEWDDIFEQMKILHKENQQ